jgi:hypothetical protein
MRSHPNKAVDVVPCQNFKILLSGDQLLSSAPSSPVVHCRVIWFALATLRSFLLCRSRRSVAHGLLLCCFRQSMA